MLKKILAWFSWQSRPKATPTAANLERSRQAAVLLVQSLERINNVPRWLKDYHAAEDFHDACGDRD